MRKLLFFVVVATILIVTTEAAAWLGWRVQSGSWQSLDSIDELRTELVESDASVSDAPARRRARRLQQHFGHKAVHPYLGFVNDPDQRQRGKRATPAADLGFPGSRANPLTPSDDQIATVLVTGGSVARNFAVRSDLFAKELERLPRLAGREIRVASIASGGYKQPQQLMALNYMLLLGAAPDLVVNIDGFNEIALPPVDLMPFGINPLYPRIWPYQMAEFDPTLRDTLGRVSYLQILRQRNAERFDGALAYSFAAGLLWKALDRPLERDQEAAQGVLRRKGLAIQGYQVKGPAAPTDPAEVEEYVVAAWRRSSLLMQQLCRARGIGYYHFLQPNQYVAGSKPLSREETRSAISENSPYGASVPSGYRRLRAAGRELRLENVSFYDLTEVFQDVEESLYVDDCCHFNLEGDRILARAIVEAIRSNEGAGGVEPRGGSIHE